MISGVSGKVQFIGPDWITIQTSGGVSYYVAATAQTLSHHQVGSLANLLTHLIVREDQLSLYGFASQDELKFFQKLISISGVGPRMALSILNAGPVQQIQKAIAGGDLAILTTISGVGKKTAERILVELKNQIEISTGDDSGSDSEDLLAALTQLGYNAYEVRRIAMEIPTNLSTEDRIKYALQLLSK